MNNKLTKFNILIKKLKKEYAFTSKFNRPDKITIGNKTTISDYVYLNAGTGNITIGNKCYIDRNVLFSCNGGDINIGHHCSFNPNCVIYGHGGLTIGNDVRIATGTVIIPANHGFQDREKKICDQEITAKGITISHNCWIGANVTILDGVTVGEGCVIGAGSVVTKSIEDYSIAVGSPAKIIQKR